MKERPILFSAPMVRALLAGQKTQTRRAFSARMIKLMSAAASIGEVSRFMEEGTLHKNDLPYIQQFSPYGQPGDRLWVRETFRVGQKHDATAPRDLPFDRGLSVAYAAGGVMCRDEVGGPYISHPNGDLWGAGWMGKTRVSIHMPRRASRITLEIVSIRVERLQDISEADAIAEGTTPSIVGANLDHLRFQAGYQTLWESLNGAGSWASNPWVWVVEFRRIES